ncbi:MAG: ATP-binding protein [Bacteroidetes bacterium]|nr:ATP-binding protein [Bacteroidota bacterium]
MEKKVKRIALLGPESTAKSTLSEQLALHYQTQWVKEHAREYLSRLNKKYTLEDIVTISQEQLAIEQELLPRSKELIFIDTEFINAKIWCLDVFKTCPEYISKNITEQAYDLYLLTYPDLPWKPDPLRENPNRREYFFNWYEQELKEIGAKYTIIKGSGQERFSQALRAVENFKRGL